MSNYAEHIVINVSPTYLPDQSSPLANTYVWSYTIKINNCGTETIQLLERYWKITDAEGRIDEVEGPGVVGLQPIIKPGKTFVYSSICQLPTRTGAMTGFYIMQTVKEERRFKVFIPEFLLTSMDAPPPYEKTYQQKTLH